MERTDEQEERFFRPGSEAFDPHHQSHVAALYAMFEKSDTFRDQLPDVKQACETLDEGDVDVEPDRDVEPDLPQTAEEAWGYIEGWVHAGWGDFLVNEAERDDESQRLEAARSLLLG